MPLVRISVTSSAPYWWQGVRGLYFGLFSLNTCTVNCVSFRSKLQRLHETEVRLLTLLWSQDCQHTHHLCKTNACVAGSGRAEVATLVMFLSHQGMFSAPHIFGHLISPVVITKCQPLAPTHVQSRSTVEQAELLESLITECHVSARRALHYRIT